MMTSSKPFTSGTINPDDDNSEISYKEPSPLILSERTTIGDLRPVSAKATAAIPTQQQEEWQVIGQRELIARDPWLRLYEQSVVLPNGRQVDDFHHLHLPDHVVIYARTNDNMVATLRQYKHGLRAVTTTLPGGMVGEGENPYFAAQRELREETGLASERWYLLGRFRVNGNLGGGDGYCYLADNCYFADKSDSGDLEEAVLEWLDAKSLRRRLHAGEQPLMHHALAIALVRSFESDP